MDRTIFPFLDKSDLSDKMQAAFERSLNRRGEARLISAMGHAPDLFEWYITSFYEQLFYGGSVPVIYKELGRLRLSEIHGCKSCNLGNRADASTAGIPRDKILFIYDPDNPVFDDVDRAVIELADLMSLHAKGQRLNQGLYDNLRRHFDDGQIIELAMTLAMLSGMAHFLFSFDMVEKEDNCKL
jgi:alkylhydroperoxidase family enzyme